MSVHGPLPTSAKKAPPQKNERNADGGNDVFGLRRIRYDIPRSRRRTERTRTRASVSTSERRGRTVRAQCRRRRDCKVRKDCRVGSPTISTSSSLFCVRNGKRTTPRTRYAVTIRRRRTPQTRSRTRGVRYPPVPEIRCHEPKLFGRTCATFRSRRPSTQGSLRTCVGFRP